MKKKLKCFVCHKEINEEEDYVFKGQTVHKGECLKSMIDEYNAVRNLQIRNKRLCVEIDRLNNLNKQLVEECQRLDDEETRLNNIINRIDSFVDRTIEVIKHQPSDNDEWILERLNGIKYLKELKEK